MITERKIRSDPFAWEDVDKVHKQLSTLIHAIKLFRKRYLELAEKICQSIEPLLDAEAEKWKAAYFNYLFELREAHGASLDDVELQIRYPKLRKLYVKCRVAAEIANLFRWLL